MGVHSGFDFNLKFVRHSYILLSWFKLVINGVTLSMQVLLT